MKLTRQDGTQFILQPIRENLAKDGNSRVVIKKNIQNQASTYGQFISIVKEENNYLRIAYSREEGFLLAETIQEYFGHPLHLVFMEYLDLDDIVLIVVIQDGNITCDSFAPIGEPRSELNNILVNDPTCKVKIIGYEKLLNDNACYRFIQQLTALNCEIEQLDTSVFAFLPNIKKYECVPTSTALHRFYRLKLPWKWITSALIICIVVVGLIYFWPESTPSQPLKTTPVAQQPAGPSPEELALKQALNSPNIEDAFIQIQHKLMTSSAASDWQTSDVQFKKNTLTISLTSKQSSLSELILLGQKLGGSVKEMAPNKAEMIWTIKGKSSLKPKKPIENIPLIISHIFAQRTLSYSLLPIEEKKEAYFRRKTITVKTEDLSISALSELGKVLNLLPIYLDNLNMKISYGTLSGTIGLEYIEA